jgi:hypothetical protein
MKTIQITDASVVELIRGKMPVATELKDGLKPAKDMRMEKRTSMTSSVLLFGKDDTNNFSDGILFSVQAYGGGPVSLYFLSIWRTLGDKTAPKCKLNLIGGTLASESTRPRFKLYNTNTGAFKVFLERKEYTIGVYAKLLSSYNSSSFEFILKAADESEVAAASYIEEE